MATVSVLHPLLQRVLSIIGSDKDLAGLVNTIISALSKKTNSRNTIINQFCDMFQSQVLMPKNIEEVILFLNYTRFCNPPKLNGRYDDTVLHHYFSELIKPQFIRDLETVSSGASKELTVRSSLAFKFNNEICYERVSLLRKDSCYTGGGASASYTGRGRGRGRGRGGRGRGGGSLRLTYDFIDKGPCEDSRSNTQRVKDFTSKICSFLWEEVVAESYFKIGINVIASIHLPNMGDLLVKNPDGTFMSIEVKATTDDATKMSRLSKADDCVVGFTGLILDPSTLDSSKLNIGIEEFEISTGVKPKTVTYKNRYVVEFNKSKFADFESACINGLRAARVYNKYFLSPAGKTRTILFKDLLDNDPNLSLSIYPSFPSTIAVTDIEHRKFVFQQTTMKPILQPTFSPGGGASTTRQKYIPPNKRGHTAPGGGGGGGGATAPLTRKTQSKSGARPQRIIGEIKKCCNLDFGGNYDGTIRGDDGIDYQFKLSFDPQYKKGTIVSFKPNPATARNPIATDIQVESRVGKINNTKKNRKKKNKRNSKKKLKNTKKNN